MATHAPTTGAPTGAPETPPRAVSLLAADVQVELERIAAIAYAIDRAVDDLPGWDDDWILGILTHAISLAKLSGDLARKAGKMCEEIEVSAGRLELGIR